MNNMGLYVSIALQHPEKFRSKYIPAAIDQALQIELSISIGLFYSDLQNSILKLYWRKQEKAPFRASNNCPTTKTQNRKL